jgi:hypothetical protein
MKHFSVLFLTVVPFGILIPVSAQTVINCPSGFNTPSGGFGSGGASVACGVNSIPYPASQPFGVTSYVGPLTALSGNPLTLIPYPGGHTASTLMYQTAVNVQAFTTSFTYIADGKNIGIAWNNTNNQGANSYQGAQFDGGAGCEAGFYQAFTNPEINNVFALELDSGSGLSVSEGYPYPFVYTSAQIYTSQISPCIPPYTGSDGNTDPAPDKISTSPVPLGRTSSNSTNSDVLSATIIYDGSNLTLNVYDITAGGTCTPTSSATCFTHTWTGVNIPSAVDGDTAYVGLTGGTNSDNTGPLVINSFIYTVESPGAASSPTFSPVAGTYSGSQSVTLSSASSGAVICYGTTGSPATNGSTNCASGTLYSGPITVSSSETLYAVAGGTGYQDSPVASSAYVIQPTASTPTFSPAAGAYTSAQSVTISDATSGATIYYTTNGSTPTTSSTAYTGSIAVNSTETLEAIAGETGDTNSAVASAAYTITYSPPPTVSTPTLSPAAGAYTSAQSVTISDATSGATIYYTNNGTTPTTSSTPYAGPIAVSSTETLDAIAVETGDINSAVASAAYTITSPPPMVSTPTFSPAAGAYTSAQSVNISDATSGASIYYTTNGTTPTTSSTPYVAPVAVSSTETLDAIAVASGDTNSAVASAAYTITSPPPAVSTPTFSPAAGAYTSAQSVNISDATSGATIYYTNNGTTPTTSSTPYAGPIAVSSTETLEAIAVASGDTNSAVASAAYTITPTPPTVTTPVFSLAEGTYTSAQSVNISDATSGATIYYTTNGSTPTTSSTAYTGSITVSSTETLEAIAVVTGDTNSAVASAAYTITPPPPTVSTPTFSPAAGAYASAQSVTISDATSGATIYYTTNGTTPTASSSRYTGPIAVSSTETLEAIAVDTGDTNSAVASAAYTINTPPPTVSTPTFSPATGAYTSAQSVNISDATSGATIYYTTNGTTPTTSSTPYAGPIAVSSTETLEAIAVKTGDTNSAVASAAYTITSSPPPTVSTPTFSPAAGAYASAQSVAISDATSGAAIYYTTNGTTPTTSSILYTGPIAVSSTETLEAIAVDSGDTNSAVASAAYTITSTPPTVSTPTFSPAAGAYASAQSVNISDATSSAAIYYTTNGTTPTTSSSRYTGPIAVSSTETLEAIAVDSGDTNSAVASAAFTITLQPNFVLSASEPSLTVNSGGQAALMLTVTPENGFNSPVTFACSGLPSGATCSFDQDTVTPSGDAATTQLTISINTQSSALPPESRPFFPLTALAFTLCFFGRRKRRFAAHWLFLVVACASLGLLCGCVGGVVSSSAPASTSSSTVTVTAASGTLQQDAPIVLTVN